LNAAERKHPARAAHPSGVVGFSGLAWIGAAQLDRPSNPTHVSFMAKAGFLLGLPARALLVLLLLFSIGFGPDQVDLDLPDWGRAQQEGLTATTGAPGSNRPRPQLTDNQSSHFGLQKKGKGTDGEPALAPTRLLHRILPSEAARIVERGIGSRSPRPAFAFAARAPPIS